MQRLIKLVRHLTDLWVIAGITLLLLILIEIGFTVYYNLKPSSDPRTHADCYDRAAWVEDYYREFGQSAREVWEPYVYWRRESFTGKYININQYGLRASVYEIHEAVKHNPEIRIFFFGGSTIWGTGVRDGFTIPSLVGAHLTSLGYNVSVYNYGESGYVTMQEVMALMIQMRKNNLPDIAVFFDGVNDVFSAFQQGKAGIPQNEFNREEEFNAFLNKRIAFRSVFRSLQTLSTVRFFNSIFHGNENFSGFYTEAEMNRLAGEVLEFYFNSLRKISSLEKEFYFESLFYWQPVLFHKPLKTDYEREMADEVLYLEDFLQACYGKMAKKPFYHESPRFFDIQDIFSEISEPLFIDWCHTGEVANRIIAEKIGEDLVPICEKILQKRNETDRTDQTEY